MSKKAYKERLKVGTQIRIGEKYAKESYGQFKAGEVITLVEGHFEYDNGLYCEDQICPAIWNKEEKDFDSIFHLFGNDLERFLDCEIINPHP